MRGLFLRSAGLVHLLQMRRVFLPGARTGDLSRALSWRRGTARTHRSRIEAGFEIRLWLGSLNHQRGAAHRSPRGERNHDESLETGRSHPGFSARPAADLAPRHDRVRCFRGTVSRAAWRLHQAFKFEFLTHADRLAGQIEWEQIAAWLTTQETGEENEAASGGI